MAKNTVAIVVDSLENHSQIFERSWVYVQSTNQWMEKLFDFFCHNVLVDLLVVGFIWFICRALYFFGRMIVERRRKSHSLRNSIFSSLVFACFFAGAVVYYYGYDYAGTYKNSITLLLRSVLSSLEMFLSKSNLSGIAQNCRNSRWYMLAFACVHTLAVGLSATFAVACFWKRIKYWGRSMIWRYGFKNHTTYVFWGLNERSYMLAHDVYTNRMYRDRIIFVDFPEEKEEKSKSQGFSGLIGLLSYKLCAIRQLNDIAYVLYRSFGRPSELSDKVNDLFDELDLMPLRRILKHSKNRRHFIFTDNEASNLRAAISICWNPPNSVRIPLFIVLSGKQDTPPTL